MKTISNALAAHFALPSCSAAMLWKLKRVDGVILGFTDHDATLTYNDGTDTVTYHPTDGVTASATTNSATDTSNQEIVGFLESDAITESDIFAGRYNYATVEVRLVNWADLTMGALLWKNATLGQVFTQNGAFTAELRGLEFWLSTNIGEEYGPQCRADLGDAQCTIDLTLFVQSGLVESAADLRTFVPGAAPSSTPLVMRGSATPTAPAPDGWFSQGYVTWTSGLNNGLQMEIMTFDGTTVVLFENMPYAIHAGDDFLIYPGCDKLISTCHDKFNNTVNHRGEPFIPGMQQILNFPNASGAIPST